MKRIAVLLALISFVSAAGWSQAAESRAYIIPIHGEINPSRMIFVRRGIEKAEDDGAKYIIFDIDTFGGRVDSALQIATLIGAARSAVTIAFIPAAAEGTGVSWSAGALISLACNRIYMAPGTSIGAAAPVYQTQEGMEMADEKTVSAVRAQMAALAEKNGYPKAVAYAMVDLDVELIEVYLGDELILTSLDDLPDLEREAERTDTALEQGKTVSRSGKLLTLTAGDMLKYGISSGTAFDTVELLRSLEVPFSNAVFLEESVVDKAAAFVTGTALTGILVLVGLVTLYMEVTSPGFGVPGTIAIICFAVVFIGGALLGTVGSLELLLFLLGVVLLVVEIFLIPGLGITGISGILLIAVALVLSRQEFIWPEFTWEWDLFKKNLLVFGGSIAASVVLFGVILRLFPRLPLFSRLILQSPGQGEIAAPGTETSHPASSLPGADIAGVYPALGEKGVAVTILRPVGKGKFGDEVYEVRTDGEYLDEGTDIEIVEIHGNQILVQRR
jgi:membrane-bound serine protease (ClpP class)